MIEKIRDSKIVSEMMEDCFLPKRIYIMELDDCLESFRHKKEYSLDNWEFTWVRVSPEGLYALKSFFRPVVVQELLNHMMSENSFDGILRLWSLPEKTTPS